MNHARCRWTLSIALLTTTLAMSTAVASERQPVRVGSEIDYPPFCTLDTLNRPDGFSVELIKAALSAMGRTATFETGDWPAVKQWLEDGNVDALPLVGRTPEREAVFDFTFPYMTLYGTIVTRDDTDGIRTLEDLRGRRVAVMQADNADEFLRREDRGMEIHTTPSFQVALQELSEGQHDAVVMQRLVALRLIREHGWSNLKIIGQPLASFRQEFCFAVQKGDAATLAMLNEGLSLVIADGTFRRLQSKWFAALELPTERLIITGGDDDYPPYEFLNEQGEPDGFAVDMVRAIAKAVNLDIEIRLGSWAEMIKALETGEIDAIPSIFYSPERSAVFDFSIPHAHQHYVSVVRAGQGSAPATLDALKGLRLVAQEGDLIHEVLKEQGFQDQVYVVPSQAGVLEEVAKGRADCGLVMRLSAMNLMKDQSWDNLILGTHPLYQAEYCIAVKKGSDALLAAFNEGLQTIKGSGEYRRIQEKWFGSEDGHSFSDFLRTAKWIIAPLLLLLLLSCLWSWSLRVQVARQTNDLRANQARIDHLNRVLRALRGINQLIVREHDRDRMIQKACDLLTDYQGYTSALILLTGENGSVEKWMCDKGAAERLEPFRPVLDAGIIPPCCEGADSGENPVFIREYDSACRDCPIAIPNARSRSLCTRLTHGPEPFGCMMVTMAPDLILEEEERRLFSEIAGDLAYALHGIKADERQAATERQRESLASQLVHAQRMEAVGRLAGGVAHDFNNLLMGIMGYTEICKEELGADHPVCEHLDEIMKGANRAAGLTRQLLAFARRQTIKRVVVDLNAAIVSMLKLLRRLLRENINLVWTPGIDLWSIKMDPSQLDQILANLCVNARDAITGVGKMSIETENVTIDETYCQQHSEAIPGDYVMLAVSDNGTGMTPDVREHIFEPFFTTKSKEQGTGLGLATVYGIVKQNNGFINVYSEPDSGTTFRIYIPRADAESTAMTSQDAVVEELPRGSETILLVEDESSIRDITVRVLQSLGYAVLSADHPELALQLAHAHPDTIHVLLTDVVMPGMSGRDLARQLVTQRPDLKVLYMSGYTPNVIAHHGVLDPDIEFLAKPVSRAVLALKIRSMLDPAITRRV